MNKGGKGGPWGGRSRGVGLAIESVSDVIDVSIFVFPVSGYAGSERLACIQSAGGQRHMAGLRRQRVAGATHKG